MAFLSVDTEKNNYTEDLFSTHEGSHFPLLVTNLVVATSHQCYVSLLLLLYKWQIQGRYQKF